MMERYDSNSTAIQVPEEPAYPSGRITRLITLGPRGTCSEKAALDYAAMKQIATDIVLVGSFETAIALVASGDADAALVPAAYSGFNDLVFRNHDAVAIYDTFLDETPGFVLGISAGGSPPADGCVKVASHPAPQPLLDIIRASSPAVTYEVIIASSNATAAMMVHTKEADMAITNAACADLYGLNSLMEFGSVRMPFAVFTKRKG